jgi:hypothetical protein
MAHPVVEATSTWQVSGTSNVSTLGPITLPSGVAAGDLLVAFVAVDGSPVMTGPANWHMLRQEANTTVVKGAVFWRRADGVDDALSVGLSVVEHGSAIVYRISGANFVEGAWSNGSSANSTNPAFTPTTAGLDCLWLAARAGDAQIVADTAPSGYGSMLFTFANNTGGACANTAHKTGTTVAETPGAWTSASEQWATFTLAVYDAPALAGTVLDVDGDPVVADILVIDRTTKQMHIHGEYQPLLRSRADGTFELGMPGLGRAYNLIAIDPTDALADLIATRVEPA